MQHEVAIEIRPYKEKIPFTAGMCNCMKRAAIVTKINYKLVDWQKEKFKNGRTYKKSEKRI